MNFFGDFTAINKVVMKKTNQSYGRNLILIPILAVYIGLYQLARLLLFSTIGQLGAGGGFIANLMRWFIMCFIISDFLVQVDRSIIGKKFGFNQLGRHYMDYFRPLLTATAIPSILMMLFSSLTRFPVAIELLYLFYLIYAIPEIIYQKHIDRLEMFVYGHKYIKENWQQWGGINLLFIIVLYAFYRVVYLYLVTPILINIVNAFPKLLENPLMVYNLNTTIVSLFMAVPFVYYFIYRGYVFKILSVSSRRKREYMRNIYGK